MISDAFMLPLDGLTLFRTSAGWQLNLREKGSSGWRIHHGGTIEECFGRINAPQTEKDPFE